MKRDDVERLVNEAGALNTFYHASWDPLPVGTTLQARCRKKVDFRSMDGVDLEDFVEAHRPLGENSRECSMYSTDSKKALSNLAKHGRYVYEVEPLGHVTKADFSWFWDLFGEKLRNNPEMDRIARNYWQSTCATESGAPCVPDPGQTEYLSPAMRVLREDVLAEGYMPERLPDPVLIRDPNYRQFWVRGVGIVEEAGPRKRPNPKKILKRRR